MKNSHEDTKARRVNQNPEHSKQVLTYLRLLKLPLGLVINFGAPCFKEGCKRIVNGPQSFVSSCLRVNQNPELSV